MTNVPGQYRPQESREFSDQADVGVSHQPEGRPDRLLPEAFIASAAVPQLEISPIAQGGVRDRHLWNYQPVRDFFWIALAIFLLWAGYQLRAIFIPVLIALGLAYIASPLVRWCERRWGLHRTTTVLALISLILGVVTAALIFALPLLWGQAQELIAKAPRYGAVLADRLPDEWDRWRESLGPAVPSPQAANQQVLAAATARFGGVLGVATDIVSTTTYVAFALVVIPVYFFFFARRFDVACKRAKQWLPVSRRDRILQIVRRMDAAIGNFVRGRLLVALITSVLFSLGWWMAGVPYSLLIGTMTGFLNIIPFASAAGWPLAIVLKFVEASSTGGQGAGFVEIVVWPSVVYGVVQFIDGWVLTPWVQSRSMEMSPVTVIVALLIGASVAGVYGLLLAIPLAACLKILAEEVLFPRLEHWASSS